MKTLQLPGQLIESLMELGLLESEAKIYAALVLLGYADVGDLIEALDVSKPRIYTSLGTLEERGLIVQTSPRPVIYQAVPPHIAMEMITRKYDTAKSEVMEQFKAAEKQEIREKPTPMLYYIFGTKSFEFKIKDMLDNAKVSVHCRTSDKFLKYFDKVAKKGIDISLVVTQGDSSTMKKVENLQKNSNVHLRMADMSALLKPEESEGKKPRLNSELLEMMDLDNLIALIVDDEELLLLPPLKDDAICAFTSTNKVLVHIAKNAIAEIGKGKP